MGPYPQAFSRAKDCNEATWSKTPKRAAWVRVKKSNLEQMALVTLNKRAPMCANGSCPYLKKSDISDLLVIQGNRWKKICIFHIFWQFFTAFPPFMPQSESLTSLLAPSLVFKEQQEQFAFVTLYKRANMRESLPSLITKEQPWAICSCCFLLKCNGSISLFFESKKQRSKIQIPTLGLSNAYC